MAPQLRPLTVSDLEFAHALSRQTGWNQTRRDWERFLSLAPQGCFLAEVEGSPAGTATTTAYGTDLAWIGMVLVDPAFRRRGIGTALLDGAIRYLQDQARVTCIRLDATPEGRPLYESLGFVAEWDLRRWVRGESSGDDEPHPIPTNAKADPFPPSSLELDRSIFGADRALLLESLRDGSDDGLIFSDGSFGFRRSGERAHYLGPVTAVSCRSGLDLVEALISRCPSDRPLFWDLPEANTSATTLAARLGFAPARVLTRMRLGDAPVAQDPVRTFGLAEPGLG